MSSSLRARGHSEEPLSARAALLALPERLESAGATEAPRVSVRLGDHVRSCYCPGTPFAREEVPLCELLTRDLPPCWDQELSTASVWLDLGGHPSNLEGVLLALSSFESHRRGYEDALEPAGSLEEVARRWVFLFQHPLDVLAGLAARPRSPWHGLGDLRARGLLRLGEDLQVHRAELLDVLSRAGLPSPVPAGSPGAGAVAPGLELARRDVATSCVEVLVRVDAPSVACAHQSNWAPGTPGYAVALLQALAAIEAAGLVVAKLPLAAHLALEALAFSRDAARPSVEAAPEDTPAVLEAASTLLVDDPYLSLPEALEVARAL
jgi:hypothetical protein